MTEPQGETAARTVAEIRLPTQELRDDIPFFTKTLGMRMDMIYPADSPRIAVFSGHGLRIRPLMLLAVTLIILAVQFVSLGLVAELVVAGQRPEADFRVRRTL